MQSQIGKSNFSIPDQKKSHPGYFAIKVIAFNKKSFFLFYGNFGNQRIYLQVCQISGYGCKN